MPDYNRAATQYWWLAVGAGGAVLLYSAAWLLRQPWTVALQVAAALLLAVGSGLFPVRVPGTRISIAAGEIFIFLLLLVAGPQAAAIVAAGEVAVGAWRMSRRWTSRLISPAVSALSMASMGGLLQWALARMAGAGLRHAAAELAVTMLFAVLYFFVNTTLLAGSQHLKRGEPFFQVRGVVSVYRWVGMAYAGSASVAMLLHITWRQQGVGVLLVMVPLLAMLLVTLHFYFRQQEAGEALRQASAGVAAREAAMVARESQAAQRHLRELQASERRFHSAFTHASIAMALLAFDGRILQANAALATLLGIPENTLLERNFQTLVVTEDRDALAQQLGLAGAPDFEGFTHELRCQHADGSTVWLTLHCSFFTEPETGTDPGPGPGPGQP